jgi:hypothetical protein
MKKTTKKSNTKKANTRKKLKTNRLNRTKKIHHTKRRKLKSKKLIGGTLGYNNDISGVKYDSNNNDISGVNKKGDIVYRKGDYLYSIETPTQISKLMGFNVDRGYVNHYSYKCLTREDCGEKLKIITASTNIMGKDHKIAGRKDSYGQFTKGNPINYNNMEYTIDGFLETNLGITHCILKSDTNPFLEEEIIPVKELPGSQIDLPVEELPGSQIDLPNILKKFNYFCWDFDDTIAHNTEGRNHLSLDKNMFEALKIDGEKLYTTYFYDAKSLIELMIYLIKNGKQIFIISFGDSAIITELLNVLFNYYFTYIDGTNIQFKPVFIQNVNVFGILTAGNGESPKEKAIMKERKFNFIEQIFENNHIEMNLENLSKVLFFDDDPKNIIRMTDEGVKAYTVPGTKSGTCTLHDHANCGFRLNKMLQIDQDLQEEYTGRISRGNARHKHPGRLLPPSKRMLLIR